MRGEIRREDYTWEMVARDLAVTTSLTIGEAASLVWAFQSTQMAFRPHPYDTMPLLKKLATFGRLVELGDGDANKFGHALVALLNAAATCTCGRPHDNTIIHRLNAPCHEPDIETPPTEPSLGLATTQELINELHARADVARIDGHDWPHYRTVDPS